MTGDPDWDGARRRVDADFLRDVTDADFESTTYLVAGPPPMVEGVAESLGIAGVAEDQIRPERYSGYE
jgi:NAD(P)H-flavin reductase